MMVMKASWERLLDHDGNSVECMASYLVLSTINYDQVSNLVGLINNSSRREVIEQCILFGVEHDEQTWIWTIITRKVSSRC